MSDGLKKAIEVAGGPASLAARIGTTVQVVSNWRHRGVPAKRCKAIEAALEGQVTCSDLRPDIFGSEAEGRPQ